MSTTLKGLHHPARGRDATPSELKNNLLTVTQGSSPTRNPGLIYGIPLGFREHLTRNQVQVKTAAKVERASTARRGEKRANTKTLLRFVVGCGEEAAPGRGAMS